MLMRVVMFVGCMLWAVAVFANSNLQSVNINTADAATLDRLLNGVGPAKAEAIVRYRKENGPFKRLEDLERVKGIGPKLLEKNRSVIRL